MENWTKNRWVSFIVHAGFVAIPFTASTVSSLLFWQEMFQSWQLAVTMIVSVELLALTGLVLYIARIESPFTWLRHLLPFISIGPLGYELYRQLAHNGVYVASIFTGILVILSMYIAHQCFATIEMQFIDPATAAKEKAHEEVARLEKELLELQEKVRIVNGFVIGYANQQGVSLQPTQKNKLIPADAATVELKPCPRCGTGLAHMKYVQAHRKVNGELRGCENCATVLIEE
jgi:hypothetical protein